MSYRIARVIPALGLIAFLVWFGVSQGTDRFWITLGIQAMWTATAVMGLNILLGYTGMLSLGHYAFFIYGGFIGAIWGVEGLGLDPWLGFPLAFFVGGALGAALALTCCHLRGFYLAVVTLAFGLIAASTALLFRSAFNGLSGRAVNEPLDTNFWFIDEANPNRPFVGLYWIGVAMVLITLYATWNLVHSRWGRGYKAIRESEVAARACGVPAYRYKVSAFGLSAGIVSLAGVLAAQTNLQVTMVDGTTIVAQSFRLVIYAVLGGIGTLAGPILGAFAFTLGFGFELGGESLTERLGRYETLFFGVLVIVTVIVVPEGVVGTLSRLMRRVRTAPMPPRSRAPVPPLQARSQAPGDTPILEVRGVTVRFGGLTALHEVDLTVAPGSVHAVIGPNGSGKTTLVNVISGVYRSDSGGVSVGGRDIAHLPAHRRTRRGIARTFQACQIWRRMTVLENVMVGGHTGARMGLPRSLLLPSFWRPEERRLRDRAWALLDFVGLAERAADPAGALPFADQRRLEIARALAADPDVLLLDEPAAGMQPAELRQLEDLIRAITRAGITVVLVEHHMDVVMELSDRITVLEFGRVIADGTADAVRHDPAVAVAYLGSGEKARVVGARPPVPTPSAGEPVLRVGSLEVRYGAARVLHGIDVDVCEGEIVAVIGSNGAGKTTTLKTVSGVSELLRSSRGEIRFLGERIDRTPAHRIARMGLVHVPEGRRVFPESSVEENLLLGAYRRRDRRIAGDLEAAYERFPILRQRRLAPAGLLSGGEQQMLAIARGLLAAPRLLLLDEPSLGLAPQLVDDVFATLRSLADDGVTILLVEQLAARALEVANRAYVLECGCIVADGSTDALASDRRVQEAYLGRDTA